MKRAIWIGFIVLAVSFTAFANGSNEDAGTEKKVIELTLYYMNEQDRFDILNYAAESLNERLAADNIEIQMINDHYSGNNRAEWRNNIALRVRSGNAPEMYCHSHANLPFFVNAGYIRPVDDIINGEGFSDTVQIIKDVSRYNGHYYGVPQSICARNLWFSKDNLRKIGMTDTDFDQLFEDSLTGDITMDDFMDLCAKVKKAGVSDYVFTHRPVTGAENLMTVMHFDGEVYDEAEGKLVLDRAAMEKNLRFYYDNVFTNEYTPSEMMDMSWDEVVEIWSGSKTTFWLGGIWNRSSLVNYTPYDKNTVMDHWGIMMLPSEEAGGKPLSLSNPWYYYVSSDISDEKYAYAKMVLDESAKPEFMTPFCLNTSLLAPNSRVANDPTYMADSHLSKSYRMLEYSTVEPHHEKYPMYADILTEAMSAIEHGKLTPPEAVDFMEQSLKAQMPDDIIIR